MCDIIEMLYEQVLALCPVFVLFPLLWVLLKFCQVLSSFTFSYVKVSIYKALSRHYNNDMYIIWI
jgi:hypothetical protein